MRQVQHKRQRASMGSRLGMRYVCIAAGATLAAAPALMAFPGSINTYLNTGTGDWTDANNWSLGYVPSMADEVTINSNGTVNLAGDQGAERITVGSIATGAGTLSLSSGSFSTVGDIRLANVGGATGVLNQSGGDLRILNQYGLWVGNNGTGTYTITGGTAQFGQPWIQGTSFADLIVGAGSTGVGTLNLSDGATITAYGIVQMGRGTGSAGTINMTGGALNVAHDFWGGWGTTGGQDTINQSGGTITTGWADQYPNPGTGATIDGNFQFGLGNTSSTRSVYTMSGTAVLNTNSHVYIGGTGGNNASGNNPGYADLIMNGGTINVGGPTNPAGSFYIGNAGTAATASADGTVTVNNGLINMPAQGATLAIGQRSATGTATGTGTLTINGGQVLLPGGLVIIGRANGAQGANGTLNLAGGQLTTDSLIWTKASDTDTSTKVFNWTGGTLDANSAATDFAITNAGGTFRPGGTATKTFTTTGNDGSYAQSSGSVSIDLASNADYDALDLSGGAVGAANLTGGSVNVAATGSYAPAFGAAFPVITAKSIGDSATWNLPSAGAGNTWDRRLSTDGNGNQVESLAVVRSSSSTLTSGSSWGSATWSAGTPNAADASAKLAGSGGNISIDAPTTLGYLQLDGSGSWTVGGSSTLSFNASSGPAGIMAFGGSHTISAPVAFNSNSAIGTQLKSTNVTLSGNVSGSATVEKTGPGSLTLSSTSSPFTGTWSISGGSLNVDSDANLGAAGAKLALANATINSTGALNSARSITLNSSGVNLNLGGDSTLSGTISGAGGITKSDATTLTLAGANNYIGATTINAGTLRQGAANSIPAGSAVVLDGGGKLALNGFAATLGSISNTGTGATDTITTGGANLTVGGDNTDTLFKGNIDGGASGTFTKIGSGILQISGVGSTLIGGGPNWVINTDPFQPINVNGGVLQFNGLSTGSLELGSDVNVAAGATLALGGSYKTAYAVHGAGSLQINGGTGIELTVPNDYTGGTKIRGATVTVDTMDAMGPAGTPIDILPQLGSSNGGTASTIKFATDGTFSHPVNMPANGYYTINFNAANQNVTLDQGVTGASQIYYSNGTFTINAKNTNSGATNVHPAATTVKLGIDDAFNSKYFTLVNGTLDLNGHNLAVGSLIGNSGGKIILSAGNTLTTGLDNVDSQNISSGSYGGGYSGVMTGAGGLTKIGTGQALMTMKYDANNLPYTGPTHVEQGTLWYNLDARSASGTSGFTVDPGALLIFGFTKAGSGGVAPHIDQVITGGGTVQKNNNIDTLELTADNTYTGGTNITAGSLLVSKDSSLGAVSGPVRFLNAGTSQTLQFTNGLTTSRNLISASPNAIVDTNGFDVQVGNIDGNTDPRLPIGGFAKSTGTGTLTATHVRVDALSVNAGTLKIAAGGGNGGVSSARTVTTADGALLDLTDNKLIVTAPDSTGTWNGTAYDGVSGLVQSGRSSGAWNGTTGIISSTAASNPNPKLFSIGVVKAGDIKSIADDATATFAGQTIHGSDTLAMYTYGGDANLDGKINIDDYGLIDSHVGQSGTAFGWHNGDFNYDGKINIDDYGIIDGNIGAQGAPIPTAAQSLAGIAQLDGVSAVPEPASLGLIALAGAGLLRRRRRQI